MVLRVLNSLLCSHSAYTLFLPTPLLHRHLIIFEPWNVFSNDSHKRIRQLIGEHIEYRGKSAARTSQAEPCSLIALFSSRGK